MKLHLQMNNLKDLICYLNLLCFFLLPQNMSVILAMYQCLFHVPLKCILFYKNQFVYIFSFIYQHNFSMINFLNRMKWCVPSIRKIAVVNMHNTIPQIVGIKNAITVHFKLPVSFFIVNNVVIHGKWNTVNSITFIAVSKVHPFCLSISPIINVSSKSTSVFAFK